MKLYSENLDLNEGFQPAKIIRYLLLFLLNYYAILLRFRRHSFFYRNRQQSALIVPPASPGNLGDEALIVATIEYLKQINVSQIGLTSSEPARSWQSLGLANETVELSSPLNRTLWQKCRFLQAAGRYEWVYILGADMLDGHYSDRETLLRLNFAALANRSGAKVVILGSSLNSHPTSVAAQALGNLPPEIRLYARDLISQQRFSQLMNRHIDLVADVAFLLQPNRHTKLAKETIQWIQGQKAKRRKVIGINASMIYVPNLKTLTVDDFSQFYTNALIELYNQDEHCSFIFIIHDFRDQKKEEILTNLVFEALPPEMRPDCLKIFAPYSAAEIKAICGELDFVLSGKMHLAIACLGQGTPVACITYQGKFEGLFQHFELEGLWLEPSEAFQSGSNLVNFLRPLIEQSQQIRQHIQSRIPKVRQLAEANFERI